MLIFVFLNSEMNTDTGKHNISIKNEEKSALKVKKY